MSDEPDYENDDQSGKGLRDQVEALSKKFKAAEAANAQLTKELNSRRLTDVLTAKGANPKLAKFATADGVDPSDETAVDAWLTDNADLFSGAVTKAEPPAPTVSSQEQAAFQQFQQQADGLALNVSAAEALLASIPEDATPDQVAAAFRASGL